MDSGEYFDRINVSFDVAYRELTRELVDSGTTQVVSLGVGIDTILEDCLRERPDVKGFAVDFDKTIGRRVELLDRFAIPHAAVSQIGADMRDSARVFDTLRNAGFDRSRPALVCIERVLCYLDREAVVDLFAMLDEFLAPGSYVAYDVLNSAVNLHKPDAWGDMLHFFPDDLDDFHHFAVVRAYNEKQRQTRAGLAPLSMYFLPNASRAEFTSGIPQCYTVLARKSRLGGDPPRWTGDELTRCSCLA
uniref:[Phosphatase 2A protein]-leucine-carboxy methyltransferase 1 n=1 Tax=Chrysocystis fragilis TaxID=1411660 RepID=A0A7S0TF07_9STRA